MTAAELAVLLSRPAPRHLIELDMTADERTAVRAEQRHQFERGLLLWAKTGHPSACGLMREAMAVIGATQPDPVARQFCWLAEAALETCQERDAASRELVLALGREVKTLAEDRFVLPDILALKLWQRVSDAPVDSDTIAAVQRHYQAMPLSSVADAGVPVLPELPDSLPPSEVQIPELDIAFDPIEDDAPATASSAVPELADSLPLSEVQIPELDIAFDPIKDDAPATASSAVPELADSLPPSEMQIPELDIAFDPIEGDAPATAGSAVPELADSMPPSEVQIPELDIAFDPIEDDAPATASSAVPELADSMPPPEAQIPELDIAFDPIGDTVPAFSSVTEAVEAIPELEAVAEAVAADLPAQEPLSDVLPTHPAQDVPALDELVPTLPVPVPESAAELPELDAIFDELPSLSPAGIPALDDAAPPSPAESQVPPPAAPLVPTRTEPHPDVAIYAALTSALQSNWQRIAGGSALHFGLFHDALLTLVGGLPTVGIAPLSRLAEILLARAEELPVAGPAKWEAAEIAAALQTMSTTLMAYPEVTAGHRQILEEHCARLALAAEDEAEPEADGAVAPPVDAAPLPEATLAQLAADIGTLTDVPAAAPGSISLDEIPLLSLAADREESEENRAADNRAIDRAAFVLMAGAQVRQLAHAHALARQAGIDSAFVDCAATLAAAASQADEPALAELAAAYAAALDGCRHSPVPLLELSADVIAVLADMAGSVQRGESVEAAPDLVEVLVELTPAAALAGEPAVADVAMPLIGDDVQQADALMSPADVATALEAVPAAEPMVPSAALAGREDIPLAEEMLPPAAGPVTPALDPFDVLEPAFLPTDPVNDSAVSDPIEAPAMTELAEDMGWTDTSAPLPPALMDEPVFAPPSDRAAVVSHGQLMPDGLPELSFDDLPDLGFVNEPPPKAVPPAVAMSDPFDFELPVLGEDKTGGH